MLGVPLGMILSTALREKYPRSDPLICGIGLVLSSIFVFVAFFFTRVNVFMGFALVLIGEVALNLNWSIVADIALVSWFMVKKDQTASLHNFKTNLWFLKTTNLKYLLITIYFLVCCRTNTKRNSRGHTNTYFTSIWGCWQSLSYWTCKWI